MPYVEAPLGGPITFLFTDIVGSTRLWEEHPEAMGAALARHDALLGAAVAAAGGRVFKHTGDGMLAAFSDPAAGLEAAVAAQRALLGEPWAEPVVVRARMALHQGPAEGRDGDFYGPTLNRAARLLSAGHGGQILVSGAAAADAAPLPDGLTLTDLGQHTLRDLLRPEQVYQICHPDLPGGFPPLRSLSALRHNLPVQATSFVGRQRELGEVRDLLGRTRLLTLTGAGGCGKTRLALQAAADALDSYPDGAFLAELAPLTGGEAVPLAVVHALGLAEEAGRTPFDTLLGHLREKRMLLLLDNCEHVLDACAGLCDAVLRACPGVTVVASSRESLGINGEFAYRVPSLSLPDGGDDAPAEALARCESVQLFVDRARAASPEFALSPGNVFAVAQVCRRLDGIPLALELAAARTRALPVPEIARRLDDRFRLLTGGSRTALPRQQTLRGLIDWSYDMLGAEERALLHRLSVFSGGWTLAAAESVCSGGEVERWEVLELLASLVGKSLVVFEEGADGDGRYRLLETVRQYARERLAADGPVETEAAHARHLSWCLALAQEAESHLRGAALGEGWLTRLEREHDNLRAALVRAEAPDAPAERVQAGLRLGGSLTPFWYTRGHLTAGAGHLSSLLAAPAALAAPDGVRAKALNCLGVLAQGRGDYTGARLALEGALGIRRAAGDEAGEASAQNNLGTLSLNVGDLPAARAHLERALEINRGRGDRERQAANLGNLGTVARRQGDVAAARAFSEEALALSRAIGDRFQEANMLNNLGTLAYDERDYDGAWLYYEAALALNRECANRLLVANNLGNLGGILVERGDLAGARAHFEEALALSRELGDRSAENVHLRNLACLMVEAGDAAGALPLLAEALRIGREIGAKPALPSDLEAAGAALSALGRHGDAAPLWGAADARREEIGEPLSPAERSRLAKYDARSRAALPVSSPDSFDAAFAEGRALSADAAADFALFLLTEKK